MSVCHQAFIQPRNKSSEETDPTQTNSEQYQQREETEKHELCILTKAGLILIVRPYPKKSRMSSFPEIFLAVYQLHELCKLIYSKHLTEDNWGERNLAPRNHTCASSMNGSTSQFLSNIYTSELVVKCLSFNFSQQALVKRVENSFKCTINSTLKGPGFQKMLGVSPMKTITHVEHSELLTSFETLGPI